MERAYQAIGSEPGLDLRGAWEESIAATSDEQHGKGEALEFFPLEQGPESERLVDRSHQPSTHRAASNSLWATRVGPAMARHALPLALGLTLPLLACPKSGSEPSAQPHGEWDYSSEKGPERWAEIDTTYATCASGEMQSPIDLPPRLLEAPEHLEVAYEADDLRIVDNGHTIQVNHRGPSQIVVDGREFELVQYHFHSPSEHAETGQRHSLELHLVHTDEAGNYAVIGVFLAAAPAESATLADVLDHLPENHEHGERVFVGDPVDPSDFLPAERQHYRYHGSLTTPPCSETVTWLVMQAPVEVTEAHVEAFRKLYKANARPLQMRPEWCLDLVPPHSPLAEPDAVSE